MSEKIKFALLSTQRSGSTAIRLLINQHSKIRCHDEIFLKESGAQDAIGAYVKFKNIQKKYSLFDYHGSNRLLKKLLYNKVKWNDSLVHRNNKFTIKLLKEFVDSLYNNPKHSAPWTDTDTWNDYRINNKFTTEKAVGFKIMYYEMQNKFLNSLLCRNDMKIIHLIRQNKLKQIVSSHLAKARGQWHAENEVKQIDVTIPTTYLKERMQELLDEDDYFCNVFKLKSYLPITYEEFNTNNTTIVNTICAFLGLKIETLEPTLKKISKDDASVIHNYQDVVRVLKKTKFEKFLYENDY